MPFILPILPILLKIKMLEIDIQDWPDAYASECRIYSRIHELLPAGLVHGLAIAIFDRKSPTTSLRNSQILSAQKR
jgi:hypothetical protein